MPDKGGNSNPKEEISGLDESTQHWFAGGDVDTLFYRINRRPPITGETLFAPPSNVIDHLKEVLAVPAVVETGRRFKRDWRIGNKVFDDRAGTLTGMIGWTRSAAALAASAALTALEFFLRQGHDVGLTWSFHASTFLTDVLKVVGILVVFTITALVLVIAYACIKLLKLLHSAGDRLIKGSNSQADKAKAYQLIASTVITILRRPGAMATSTQLLGGSVEIASEAEDQDRDSACDASHDEGEPDPP